MMWYVYSQNNSGGSFVIDENLDEWVGIEADSREEADALFHELGGYFDGVEKGEDCDCCGDRWYPADEFAILSEVFARIEYMGAPASSLRLHHRGATV